MKTPINIKNKKAFFKYEILDTYCSGIVLKGTEIKSIRDSKISFTDSYCFFIDDELYLKNFHIAEYENACSYESHEPMRDRKLLLNKKELKKLNEKVKLGGVTIVPLRIFINEKGKCKLDIGLAKGKKDYEKRNSIKDRDFQRSEDRKIKL